MNIAPPTLYELQEFIITNPNYFNEDENISINQYLQNTTEKYAGGKYWLKGQLQMTPHDEITNEKMIEAEEIDKRRQIEYDGPCNGLEAASIRQHTYTFENLKKVLIKYYHLVEEECLRPPEVNNPDDKGGIFYQKISTETLIGKNMRE
jgi:hypothetical protein